MKELAKASNDYDAAKKALADVKKAVDGQAAGASQLKMGKSRFPLVLMKQVPLVTRI